MDGCDVPGIEQSQRKEILKWRRISSDLGKRELSETEFSRATPSNRNLGPATNVRCRCDVTLSQRKSKRAKFILIIPFIFLIYANVIVSALNPSGTLLDTVHFLFTEGLRSPALLIQSHCTCSAVPGGWPLPRGLHSSGVEVGLRPACTTRWLCYLSLQYPYSAPGTVVRALCVLAHLTHFHLSVESHGGTERLSHLPKVT